VTSPRDIGRTIRTIRHLKPRQIATRVRYRITKPRVTARPRPEPRRAEPGRSLVPRIARGDAWLSPTRVRLLSVEKDFGAAVDWTAPGMPRLWIYHLHYFSDLPGARAEPGREWLRGVALSWIQRNPPGTANAWDPYPLSQRIVNWITWLQLAGAAVEDGDGPILDSLALQARYLERRVEYDIMANHLFANAKALVFAGLFFGAAEGERWARKGFRILFGEIAEQVLPDGGHFERSPSYHAIVLEDILDVLNVWGVFADAVPEPARRRRGELEDAARRMLAWLATMTHPDGGAAFMNDATLGGAPSYRELVDYAGRLGIGIDPPALARTHALPASGYVRLASGDGRTAVFFDNGPLGPDYQPGHAHCDMLSLEISRDGARVLVNSGTSTYDPGEERLYERSTAAHNTLRIDGAEQSEVWGAFRVGRRARILSATTSGDSADGAHSGFRRLRGAPIHRRTLTVNDDSVEILDAIEGRGTHLVQWFFHFHPDVEVRPAGSVVELSRRGEVIGRMILPNELALAVEDGAWRPDFNVSIPNRRLVVTGRGPLPSTHTILIEWAP